MLTDAQRQALSDRLRAQQQPASAAGIGRRPAGLTELPLSFAQEQLWFLDRFAPGLPTYNVPSQLRLLGTLDVGALRSALAGVLARHEALRTRFVAGGNGQPVQVIDDRVELAIPLIELAGDGPDELADQVRQRAARAAAEPFELATGPLLRAELLRLSSTEHVLVIVVHHIVFDAWSYGVLLAELSALYTAAVTGQAADLPELAVQFADYAIWERQRLTSSAGELIDFWRDALAGASRLELPTDHRRPVLESFRGGIRRHRLGAELPAQLQALARRQGCTAFVVLLAALQALLGRYTGQQEVIVGAPSANRGRSKLQPLIGFLVNTLPMRTDLSGDPTFGELLERVRATTVAAYGHQELPLAKLVDALAVPRDPGRSPLFDVVLTVADEPAELTATGLRLRLEKVDLLAAKFDLAFFAETCADGLWLEVAYASDLFGVETVDRMLVHFEELLSGALAEPSLRLSELPLLTETELFAELVGWNDTATDHGQLPGSGCLHELFEAQANRSPQALAAVDGDRQLSYDELNVLANRCARWLVSQGVGPQVLVGVAMSPSIERLAVLLAILKAGGGYLPLDPGLPADRLAFMIADAATPLVISEQAAELTGLSGTVAIGFEELRDQLAELPGTDLTGTDRAAPLAASNAAYLIYTSGSTGQPKGVLVEHRQAVNFALGLIENLSLGQRDRVLQFASLNFDVSVLDIFCCLLSGATAVLVDPQTKLSPPALGELLRAQRVTACCLPPVLLGVLADQDFPDLRVLISAGEQLPTEVARQWLRAGLRLCNGYGPTETTVLSLLAEVDGQHWPAPIGRPLPNYQAYVLDSHDQPLPVGVVGQLHTGGAGLARGYLNQPELSAERFVADPFSDDPADRLYRTGDLVRRLPDGQLEFVGRQDGQVKLRGLRVELGEVEAALSNHPAVGQAAVLLGHDRAGEQVLTGYLSRRPGVPEPAPAELTGRLARWLPGYMIPSRLVWLDSFPLNASGKLDRATLAALPAGDDAVAPRTVEEPAGPTERALAAIFADLLSLDRVGATDRFFELGGNSLQVMQLISRVSTEFGVQLPVATVFLAPDVRGLAGHIEGCRSGQRPATAPGTVVLLAGDAAAEPLFLLHPIGGTVFGYRQLANAMAARYQVHGIQAPALAGEPDFAPADLPALAARYCADLRAVQPAGPYRIGGWSMGGLLAQLVAHQLEQAGEQVELLVLLDAPFAIGEQAGTDGELAREFVDDALRTLGRVVPATATSGQTVDDELARLAAELGGEQGGDGSDTADELARRLAVFIRHRRLMAGYQPTEAVLADTMLIGADRSPNAAAQQDWPVLIKGKLSTLLLPADHYSLLQRPQLDRVAAAVLAAR